CSATTFQGRPPMILAKTTSMAVCCSWISWSLVVMEPRAVSPPTSGRSLIRTSALPSRKSGGNGNQGHFEEPSLPDGSFSYILSEKERAGARLPDPFVERHFPSE